MNLHSADHLQPKAPGDDADEREFEAFVQGQDPLDIAAATWATRRRNGLNAQGQAELQAWLDADPRHGEALEDMAGTLGELQQLPQGDVASLKTRLPDGRLGMTPPQEQPRQGMPAKRLWSIHLVQFLPRMATAAATAAVVTSAYLGWSHWRQLPTFEQAYATARGQQLTVRLPDAGSDGSTLQLDTATQVDALLYRHRREMILKDGQAMLTIAPDAQRPFQVKAGRVLITVTGTRFSVRHTSTGLEAGQTVVSVEEGHVRVASDGSDGTTSIALTAGQKVAADAAGRFGPVEQTPPTAIATWRGGRLSFDQTPLAQALAELERYGHTGLVVRDPAVAALPIGGSYKLQHLTQFAEALPQVLPVRLVPRGQLTEIVAR